MNKIRGTESLKGELVLSSFKNRPIVAGREYPITEEDFWKDDVQKALRIGLIEYVGKLPKNINEKTQQVTIECIKGNQLILPSIPVVMKKGDFYTVNKSIFNNSDIQQAISYGLIKEIPENELTAKLSSILQKEEKPAKKITAKDIAEKTKKASALNKKKVKKEEKEVENDVELLPINDEMRAEIRASQKKVTRSSFDPARDAEKELTKKEKLAKIQSEKFEGKKAHRIKRVEE